MKSQGALVTGGAGFIGSHMVEKLLENDTANIKVIDNLSSGNYSHISRYVENNQITFFDNDLSDFKFIKAQLEDVDTVFHFAAYPEVRTYDDPEKYFRDNVLSTFNLLNAIRGSAVKYLLFSSSSTVYGKPEIIPTSENYGPLIPISHYGSSKLACESLISSFCHIYGISSYIFRFANVVGFRNNHGIIRDFVKKLNQNRNELSILGDGQQTKSYIYIKDCIDAMMYSFNSSSGSLVNIVNIGNLDSIDVVSIANAVCSTMNIDNIKYNFIKTTSDGGGWLGDVKNMNLDISKLVNLGFKPIYSSEEAILKVIKEIVEISK